MIGGLAMFTVVWIELAALRGVSIPRSVTETGAALGTLRMHIRVAVAGLVLLATGAYMAATAWGMLPWLLVALGAIVLVIVLGATVNRKLLARIESALWRAQEGADVLRLGQHLWSSCLTRTLLLLGIVVLMSLKPGWAGALLTLGVLAVAAATALFALTHGGKHFPTGARANREPEPIPRGSRELLNRRAVPV